jgi:chorismate mutase
MIAGMSADFTKDLERIRAGIDGVDNGLVELLARRRKLVLELAKIKKALDLPIYDRRREDALFERVKKWGAAHDLDEEFVEIVFRVIVMNSKAVQRHEAV